ncbi:ABC transporter permease [Ornithinicoccus halotolerans]|uniref:ABC transporter permease n=1 Tax=Ornithinicoccus halotolerans TaxID=1748220 RepID=UPI0012958B68|nr:ABC transporter permease [Ornithinicoccus halotolerans]
MSATVATTVPRRSRHAHGRSATLAGTGTLVRFMLRRDRIKLPAWVGGMGLYVVYIGAALPVLAPTEEDLAAVTPMLEQPVGRMFTGPAYGMDSPTYETFFAGGYAPYLFLIAALMSIMLVTRHLRVEEQTGRAELVRANVTGRHAPLTAALVVALITNAVAAVVVSVLAMAYGFGAEGSWLVGVGTGTTGLAFAGVAAVTVQLAEHSRSAAGMAGAVLAGAYVLRALGDMAAVGGSALSWVSPLGWPAQTAPYVLDRWWPLLLHLALAVAGAVAAYALQARRDLGAGLLSARPGAPYARPALGTPLGLAARLQRGAVIGWGVGILAIGAVDGAFTDVMADSVESMPAAVQEMFGMEALVNGYLAFLAVFTGYLTAAYVVFAVQGLRSEEGSGRAEAVLATSTSRTAWVGSHLLVIAAGAALISVVTGLGTGLAVATVMDDWALLGEVLWAHLNLLPAVLVVLGLCAVLFGWAPPLLAPVGWAVVGLMIFVGNFGELLDLPDWIASLSPLSHPAQIPAEEFAAGPLVVLAALAVVGVALGLLGFRRREVQAR